MKEISGSQLIRQGAYTAVGGLLVYGVVAISIQFLNSRKAAAAQQQTTCGCTGPH